jgi:hypothetical protein
MHYAASELTLSSEEALQPVIYTVLVIISRMYVSDAALPVSGRVEVFIFPERQ